MLENDTLIVIVFQTSSTLKTKHLHLIETRCMQTLSSPGLMKMSYIERAQTLHSKSSELSLGQSPYTWLSKVEYLLNRRTNLYEILDLNS